MSPSFPVFSHRRVLLLLRPRRLRLLAVGRLKEPPGPRAALCACGEGESRGGSASLTASGMGPRPRFKEREEGKSKQNTTEKKRRAGCPAAGFRRGAGPRQTGGQNLVESQTGTGGGTPGVAVWVRCVRAVLRGGEERSPERNAAALLRVAASCAAEVRAHRAL